jgi:hypothetical protein
MDLPVIDVPEAEAAAKLTEYAAIPHADRTPLDQAVIRAYRAVTGGGQVIRLPAAIRAGGFNDRGLPRIGVAGAEWDEVACRWSGGDLVFDDMLGQGNRGAAVGRHTVRVPVPGDDRPSGLMLHRVGGRSVVPLVPPACRPRRGKLSRCHILFEADWQPEPPRDPALIRHVAGDLWIVLSTWELTELEAAVLGGLR